MPDDFQQTVDLKKKLARQGKPFEEPKKEKKIIRRKRVKRKAEDIDEVYNDNEDVKPRPEMHTISRPEIRSRQSGGNDIYKRMVPALLAVLILSWAYFLFIKKAPAPEESCEFASSASGWYAVELINKEVYYGQIDNICSDPVNVKNVYYNYDQINGQKGNSAEETRNLRLVKRGQETHGPDGSLSLVRTQVLFIEPLKEESKVLKAILEYEK